MSLHAQANPRGETLQILDNFYHHYCCFFIFCNIHFFFSCHFVDKMIGCDDIVRLPKSYVDRQFYFCDDEKNKKKSKKK